MSVSDFDFLIFGSESEKPEPFVFNDNRDKVMLWKSSLAFLRKGVTESADAIVYEGSGSIFHFDYNMVRGKQNGCYFYVEEFHYDRDEEGKSYLKRFAGIGCYGWEGIVEKILKEKGRESEIGQTWQAESAIIDGYIKDYIYNYDTNEEIIYFESNDGTQYDSEYVGVLPSTYDDFVKWLKGLYSENKEEFHEWLKQSLEKKPLRANQIDREFEELGKISLD